MSHFGKQRLAIWLGSLTVIVSSFALSTSAYGGCTDCGCSSCGGGGAVSSLAEADAGCGCAKCAASNLAGKLCEICNKTLGGGCGCGGGLAAPVISAKDAKFCNLPVPNYPSPRNTPRPTVPTNLTYGPLMPHNSLPNYRGTYLIPHPSGGPGGTQVHWRAQTGVNALKRLHHIFELPR